MAQGFGFETRAAFNKATTWGTAVAVSAGDGFFIHTEAIGTNAPLLPDDSFTGNALRNAPSTGERKFEGTIDSYARYEGLDVMLAMLMGTEDGAVQQGATTAYYNTFKPLDDLTALFGTLVLNKQVDAWEYDSVKVNSLRISGSAGGRINFQFGLIARKLSQSPTSPVTNTVASFNSNVTESANINQLVLFEHGIFYMNAQSDADALDADDALPVSDFEINITNSLTGVVTAANDPYVDEPQREGRLELTGRITLPHYVTNPTTNTTANAILANLLAGTAMKAKLKFTTGAAGASQPYTFTLTLPQLHISSEGARAAAQGRIPFPIEFIATRATAAVGNTADFAAAQRDPWIYVQNQRSTNALA